MKKTIIICALALTAFTACGGKNKGTTTTPKADDKAGSMGGATYGKPATGGTATTPPPPATATPNPCGAGM